MALFGGKDSDREKFSQIWKEQENRLQQQIDARFDQLFEELKLGRRAPAEGEAHGANRLHELPRWVITPGGVLAVLLAVFGVTATVIATFWALNVSKADSLRDLVYSTQLEGCARQVEILEGKLQRDVGTATKPNIYFKPSSEAESGFKRGVAKGVFRESSKKPQSSSPDRTQSN